MTVTGLPAWAQHNEGTSDFTIPQTSDLSLVGEYEITIKSEILVPKDYTKADYEPRTVEYKFSILIEPCIVSDFTAVPISNIVYTIGSIDIESETYSFTQ